MNQLVVIGDPIRYSLTPVIYNAAFRVLGLNNSFNCKTLRLKTRDLNDFVSRVRDGRIKGANVTIPHKVSIIQHLDGLTKESELIKAVNVVYKRAGRVVGDNTDGIGFINSLKENNVEIKGKKAVVIGAGGVARSAAFMLTISRVSELVFLNRTVSRAEELADRIKGNFKIRVKAKGLEDVRGELEDADILINCTSVGMKGNQEGKSLIALDMLHSDLVVMDMVYHPLMTRLLKDAEEVGAKIIDGSRMFLHQGAAAFELIVGRKAPFEAMEKAMLEALK